MSPEQYYKNEYSADYKLIEGLEDKPLFSLNSLLKFAEIYHLKMRYAMSQGDSETFKVSDRAKKVAVLIETLFNLKLAPEIKRRYHDNEFVKFEMKSAAGEVFLFKGLVQDFLSKNAVISRNNNEIILKEF